ncbi:MAG: hypothetical protein ABIH03_05720 [Pseudomonadota bacterium]
MIHEFGGDTFDPTTVLRGRLGDAVPWVDVVRDGHVARVNLDAAGVAALRAWIAEQPKPYIAYDPLTSTTKWVIPPGYYAMPTMGETP